MFGRTKRKAKTDAELPSPVMTFNAKKEKKKPQQTPTPILEPSSISGTPRLLFYGNDMECQFCHKFDDWTYLYTRKQIFVCVECAKSY